MPGPVGRLVKLIGSGIGLAAEALEARKNRSRSSSAVEAVSSSSTGDRIVELPEERAAELISQGRAVPVDGDEKKPHSKEDDDSDSLREDDEDEWELDDVAAELDPPSYEESERQQSVDELVRGVVQTAPATPSTRTKLPCPVIIPQRRPKDKGRGFVRAYAPVLNDSGVDQATFLQFLKSFHQASKASPIIDIIFISATVVGFVPSVYAMAASTIVQFAAGTARELQSRKRSNNFLDDINDKLFAPRGLYAFIMTFKPNESRPIGTTQMNLNEHYVRYQEPAPSKAKEVLKGIRVSDGKTYGEFELPECAPLIYPSLEEAAKTEEGQNRLKKSQKFVADYLDRRAQAVYAREHAGSALAIPESGRQQFASRFSDPNHPANSGSLISLLTGGAINPAERRQRRREALLERRNRRRAAVGLPLKNRKAKKGGLIKRVLQQDVLYLMIVNMPSEEELVSAREALGRVQSDAPQASAAA